MMKYQFLKRLLIVFAALLVAPALHAKQQNQALMELLKALHENGTIDQQVYELVKQVAETDTEAEQQLVAEIHESTEKIVDKKIEDARQKQVQENKQKKESVNKVTLGGRIQVDAAVYDSDQAGHDDGTEIRRARLFAKGNFGSAWGYKLQYDFTGTGLSGIQDAYLDYKGLESFNIRMGHFKEPFSLQNMTSSKYVLFTERGLPHVFAEGRNIGLQLSNSGKNWSAAGGLFGDGRDGDSDEGYGLSGRLTYAPLFEGTSKLHLGASASYRVTSSSETLQYRERPESHVTNTRLIDTGVFDADSYARVVGEAAYIHGPLHLQGEYYVSSVDRENSLNPDLTFSGFYLEGGWFITGESMNYKASKGAYSRVKPKHSVGKGGIGAWQVAMRYSSLDLSDEDITGGEEDNFTLGLNWYATPDIRFSANYVDVLDVDGGPNDGDESRSFQLRSQIEF